ncbi:MAG TPA: biotin transporter BioY, partial [Spirochaetia bacterium]|nr:biotin transporter BioY [Spirochaetia bacterium]
AVRVYADLVRPADPRLARVFDAALVAGFSLLIALSAQVAIPLPFTPVPVTLQTFAVILTGCLLGSGRGALAALLYLAEGSAGLPFFSGGTAGLAHLFGPTGGYLVGCVAAALVAGLLSERRPGRSWLGRLLTLAAADIVVFVFGVTWLGAFTGMARAVVLGFVPFVVGDALKIAVAWGILEGVSLVGRRGEKPAE